MHIHRKEYWKKIKPFMEKQVIKIITGMRRVGKSYFLQQIIDQLKENKIPENRIVFIDNRPRKACFELKHRKPCRPAFLVTRQGIIGH